MRFVVSVAEVGDVLLVRDIRFGDQGNAWGDQLDDTRTRPLPGAPIPRLNQQRQLLPTERPEELPRAAAVGKAPEPETPA